MTQPEVKRARWPLAVFTLVTAASWLVFFFVRDLTPWQMRGILVVIFSTWTLSLVAVRRLTLRRAASFRWEIGTAAAAAIVAEVIQFWTPDHVPDFAGLAASATGVAIAAVLTQLWPFQPRSK